MEIGRMLADMGREQEIDSDLIEHTLAMDMRASTRPIIQDVPKDAIYSINQDVIETAYRALNQASDEFLADQKGMENNPEALGAGTVYLSSNVENYKITQAEVSEVSGVSTQSVGNRHRALKQDLKFPLK